jgi:hypothetical protein
VAVEKAAPTIADCVDAKGAMIRQERGPIATAEEGQNCPGETLASRIWASRITKRRNGCHDVPCYCAPPAEMEMACVSSSASVDASYLHPEPCTVLNPTPTTRRSLECDRTAYRETLTRLPPAGHGCAFSAPRRRLEAPNTSSVARIPRPCSTGRPLSTANHTCPLPP